MFPHDVTHHPLVPGLPLLPARHEPLTGDLCSISLQKYTTFNIRWRTRSQSVHRVVSSDSGSLQENYSWLRHSHNTGPDAQQWHTAVLFQHGMNIRKFLWNCKNLPFLQISTPPLSARDDVLCELSPHIYFAKKCVRRGPAAASHAAGYCCAAVPTFPILNIPGNNRLSYLILKLD